MYMRGVTEVKPEWLPKFVPGLCNLGKVLEEPEPRYHFMRNKIIAEASFVCFHRTRCQRQSCTKIVHEWIRSPITMSYLDFLFLELRGYLWVMHVALTIEKMLIEYVLDIVESRELWEQVSTGPTDRELSPCLWLRSSTLRAWLTNTNFSQGE